MVLRLPDDIPNTVPLITYTGPPDWTNPKTLILETKKRNWIDDYFPPPWPEGFSGRLGRLEDLSGTSLDKFAREAGLPEDRARDWRCGATPTDSEVRAMMLWACRVPGGVAVLLTDCSNTWPTRRNN